MESNKKNSSNYLTVNGEKVMVSHEVYQMIREENNHIRYLERSEFRCTQENYTACQGDCQKCCWHIKGRFWTDQDFDMEYSMAMASDTDVEAEVLSAITMEQIYEAADQVVQYGASILRMRCEENCSHREISKRLGIAHQVIDRKMITLLDYFRKNAKFFF